MKLDLVKEVTAFVISVGDTANFTDCMNHLENQTSAFTIKIIKNVAPMSAAFQKMIDACTTPYYIQVDEDMLLWPFAIEELYNSIAACEGNVGIVCAPLWDWDIELPLYGIKIYRYCVASLFPYSNKASCEMDQLDRMAAIGYRFKLLPLSKRNCRGEHGKHYSKQSIFLRWQRLFEKHRRTGHISWIEAWPEKLLERYMRTREEIHLFALLGAISGIACPIPEDCSIDFRSDATAFAQMTKYFRTPADKALNAQRAAINSLYKKNMLGEKT